MSCYFTMCSDFENYDGDICHRMWGSSVTGHAMNCWRIANSWNVDWGDDGYFRIRFGEDGDDDSVMASGADATYSKMSPSPARHQVHHPPSAASGASVIPRRSWCELPWILWEASVVDGFASKTTGGVMTKLIELNTTVPVKSEPTFTTHTDDQLGVMAQVFEKERLMIKTTVCLTSSISIGYHQRHVAHRRLKSLPASTPSAVPQTRIPIPPSVLVVVWTQVRQCACLK